jgi:hypothetical protein
MAGALSALEAIGTGFGQGSEAIMQQQQAAAQLAMQRMALQQQQMRQQSLALLLPGLLTAYGQQGQQQQQPPGPPTGFTGPGFTSPGPTGPQMPMMMPPAAPAAAPTAPNPLLPDFGQGTGLAGVPIMPSLATSQPRPTPPPPPQQYASAAGGTADVPVPPSLVPQLMRESGGNYQAQNPRSTASGGFQDINSTWGEVTQDPAWRAAMQGLGYGAAYPTAKSAPPAVQNAANIWLQAKRGNKPWAASEPGTGMTGAGQSAARGLPPELIAQGQQTAAQAAQEFDPMEYGRVQLQRAVAAIDKQDAPPEVKAMAIMQMVQIIRPEDRMMLSMFAMQNRDLIARAGLEQRGNQGEERIGIEQERLAVEQKRLGDQEAKAASGEGGTYEASKTLEILDKDGDVVRTVLAREGRGKVGWVDSTSGEPIKKEPDQQVREVTPSTSSGGRAGAQVLRQQIGGREVLSDLQNVSTLSLGQTIGLLGTVQPGTSVYGALKGDLVRALTPQDAQLMQASMAGLTKELSILMSPVYANNYAAAMLEPLIPKSGDTIGTAQFKLARLAQSADNALEAIGKTSFISDAQKKYAKDIRAQIGEAIPWSTQESMGFARFAGDGESFSAFVDRWRKNIPDGSKPVPGKTVNGMPVFAAPDGTFHSLDAAPDASHP